MAPVGSSDSRLLVLGSLPGEASLRAQRYYAHPQNQFWRLLGGALGEDLAGLEYDERLARLAARDVALWDVVGQAFREGSLDGAIRGATLNQLREYAAGHPRLASIAFNGQTAARLGRAAIGDLHRVRLVDLPSSSPAYTIPFAEKARRWAMLGALASGEETATLRLL